MKRQSYLIVVLILVAVFPSLVHCDRSPPVSLADNTFHAMLARRNHSVLVAVIGRSTAGRSIAAALSYKRLTSYQQSSGVATNSALSLQRLHLTLYTITITLAVVAKPTHN